MNNKLSFIVYFDGNYTHDEVMEAQETIQLIVDLVTFTMGVQTSNRALLAVDTSFYMPPHVGIALSINTLERTTEQESVMALLVSKRSAETARLECESHLPFIDPTTRQNITLKGSEFSITGYGVVHDDNIASMLEDAYAQYAKFNRSKFHTV